MMKSPMFFLMGFFGILSTSSLESARCIGGRARPPGIALMRYQQPTLYLHAVGPNPQELSQKRKGIRHSRKKAALERAARTWQVLEEQTVRVARQLGYFNPPEAPDVQEVIDVKSDDEGMEGKREDATKSIALSPSRASFQAHELPIKAPWVLTRDEREYLIPLYESMPHILAASRAARSKPLMAAIRSESMGLDSQMLMIDEPGTYAAAVAGLAVSLRIAVKTVGQAVKYSSEGDTIVPALAEAIGSLGGPFAGLCNALNDVPHLLRPLRAREMRATDAQKRIDDAKALEKVVRCISTPLGQVHFWAQKLEEAVAGVERAPHKLIRKAKDAVVDVAHAISVLRDI